VPAAGGERVLGHCHSEEEWSPVVGSSYLVACRPGAPGGSVFFFYVWAMLTHPYLSHRMTLMCKNHVSCNTWFLSLFSFIIYLTDHFSF
jgi:hypothetical protein